MNLSAINLAQRCSTLYLSEAFPADDPTQWSAAHRTATADALTAGLAEYWRRAPEYVTAPRDGETQSIATGTSDIAMPAGFRQVQREVRIRTAGSSDEWSALSEVMYDPLQVLTGRPVFYRVLAVLPEYIGALDVDTAPGQEEPDYIVRLYPAADKAYDVDLQCVFNSPAVRMRHLSGPQHTILLPISFLDVVTMVLPLCAKAFWLHPLRKKTLTYQDLTLQFDAGAELVSAKPRSLSRAKGDCFLAEYH